ASRTLQRAGTPYRDAPSVADLTQRQNPGRGPLSRLRRGRDDLDRELPQVRSQRGLGNGAARRIPEQGPMGGSRVAVRRDALGCRLTGPSHGGPPLSLE